MSIVSAILKQTDSQCMLDWMVSESDAPFSSGTRKGMLHGVDSEDVSVSSHDHVKKHETHLILCPRPLGYPHTPSH